MNYIEQLDKALLEVAINIAYFGALSGLTLEEVKAKLSCKHNHTYACLRYGNIDYPYICSETHEELDRDEAEELIYQYVLSQKEHNK